MKKTTRDNYSGIHFYNRYKDKVIREIEQYNFNKNEEGELESSKVIFIDGDFGSGKTEMTKRIEKQLRELEELESVGSYQLEELQPEKLYQEHLQQEEIQQEEIQQEESVSAKKMDAETFEYILEEGFE